MREALLALVLVLCILFAGCTRPAPAAEVDAAQHDPAPERPHVLAPAPPARVDANASEASAENGTAATGGGTATAAPREPVDLEAPTFRLLGALATGGVAYGAGEPSVWAAMDGSLWVSFPGCDGATATLAIVGRSACGHGLVFRSGDEGSTWQRLNREDDGRLAETGPERANGDADLAVDAAGNAYATNLGAGVHVWILPAGKETWQYSGDLVPEDAWADRQWIAAAGAGHAILAWMGGADTDARQVAVATTRDAGSSWSSVTYLGEEIGWLGSVQFAPDGRTAYIPYTQPLAEDGLGLLAASEFGLFVAKTEDGGSSWQTLDTGLRVRTTETGGRWSGVLMAPSLDVTGDGHVALAWSEEVPDATGLGNAGAALKVATSADGGKTWSAPFVLGEHESSIMPWVTGGAGDRYAVTYLASDVPLDPERAGVWDVMAAVVDGAASPEPKVARTVVDRGVHEGGICTVGSSCLTRAADRALLDFFESDLLPDGRLVVVYPADPLSGGKRVEIRVAVQDGGTPLLVAP